MVTATIPDLLRLFAVPVFGWAAVRDIETRRVPNQTWIPLAALGIVLILWDVWLVTGGGFVDRLELPFVTLVESADYTTLNALLLRTTISVGFVVPLSYVFWRIGGFGGADAKALMALAVLFPTYPHYLFDGFALPWFEATVGVFSLTILSNTVLAGAVYPGAMALRNAVVGDLSKLMFIGRRVGVAGLPERYGRLLERPDGVTRSGMDLDVLRMYLSWRQCSLADLRADPERHRDPDSLPDSPGDPGDGTVPATDGGEPVDEGVRGEAPDAAASDLDDPWGAEAFFEDIGGPIYGTDPESLREGLAVLAGQDRVWYSPGIPFIVPMFGGLLLSLVAGDVLVWLLTQAGLG